MLLNVLFAAVAGVACGIIVLTQRPLLNQLMSEFEQSLPRDKTNFQFSMRGLFLLMSLTALAAAAARTGVANRPVVLGVIYALGPWILIAIAYLPRGIPWQQRVWILIPITFAMIAAAVMIGGSLTRPLPFDMVLMGIFICWTPQTAIVAAVLTVAIVYGYRSRQGAS